MTLLILLMKLEEINEEFQNLWTHLKVVKTSYIVKKKDSSETRLRKQSNQHYLSILKEQVSTLELEVNKNNTANLRCLNSVTM